jgi:2-methylcitrate dehydratase PrpD
MRSIQGWTAQNAIVCSRHAQLGITGPVNFLTGTYGYYHLFGKDMIEPESILTGLGKSFGLEQFIFKKYPSCGLTQSCTEIILKLIKETDITPENTEKIRVKVHPYAFNIAGHPFQTGENPRANGMFSIRYCIASAIMRKESRLISFEEEYVQDPGIKDLTDKIDVISDPGLIDTGHTAVEITILTSGGREYTEKMDVAPGFPSNPLTQADHENHFFDCIGFSKKAFSRENGEKIIDMVDKMESLDDVRVFIPLLVM